MMKVLFENKRVRLREAVEEDALSLAPNVKDNEVEEMLALTPDRHIVELVMDSFNSSFENYCLERKSDGMPLIVCGFAPADTFDGGIPWLLSRPEARRFWPEIIRRGAPIYMERFRTFFKIGAVLVGVWLPGTIKWLRALGFNELTRTVVNRHEFALLGWRSEENRGGEIDGCKD